MKARVFAVAVIIAAAAAPAAQAAPWNRVTTPDGSSTDQVGLARTADGVLHVAWHHPTGPEHRDLLHTVISPAGKVGATTPVQSGWTGFTNPALVVEPGGLRAFWGGFRSTDSSDPQNETNTALSPDGGASWALQPGSVVPLGAQSYASNTAATVRADGSTLQSLRRDARHVGARRPLARHGQPRLPGSARPLWLRPQPRDRRERPDRPGLVLQRGRTPRRAGPGRGGGRRARGCRGDDAGHERHAGRHARPHSPRRRGRAAVSTSPTRRAIRPRTACGCGGSAPPTAPLVGRVRGSGSPAVAVAAAGDGRLWVVWTEGFGDPDVLARRSNKSATKFGATVNAGHPKDALQAYKVDASAAGGALDVLGNFNIDTSATAVTSYRRLLPGLTLQASARGSCARARRPPCASPCATRATR